MTKGIRIFDKKNEFERFSLSDFLKEIHNGQLLHWSILFLDVFGSLGEEISVPVFEQHIIKSEKGFFITWNDLNELANKIDQLIAIILIGCRDKNLLERFEDSQEMYETCNIVIEMVDSYFWEVFSKDHNLIDRLAAKFKDIEFLETNFQKKFKTED